MKATADKPKTNVHDDPRHVEAQGNVNRIQQQRGALLERIGTLESQLAQPQTFGRQAALDQAASRVLGGQDPGPVMPRRNLADELSEARAQLLVLDRALVFAAARLDQAASDASVDFLPALVEENRRHNRTALELDIQRSRQEIDHQNFLAKHSDVKALPGLQWPSSLGVLVDPYSLIRGRCREALELGIISESELQDILAGEKSVVRNEP